MQKTSNLLFLVACECGKKKTRAVLNSVFDGGLSLTEDTTWGSCDNKSQRQQQIMDGTVRLYSVITLSFLTFV